MKTRTTSHTLDTLPPLTASQRQQLDALAAKPEAEIDTGDIPELTDDQLAQMRRPGVLYKPVKKQVTARIDADVLDWLKSFGKGYQSRMNAILRREMLKNQ